MFVTSSNFDDVSNSIRHLESRDDIEEGVEEDETEEGKILE